MIYKEDCTLPKEYLEQLTWEGLESLPEMIQLLMNQAMQIEREKHLNAKPYERSDARNGHANGYKPKTVKTRVGELTFDIPQVREGGFYPRSLEKGMRRISGGYYS
jgi:putative transposase